MFVMLHCKLAFVFVHAIFRLSCLRDVFLHSDWNAFLFMGGNNTLGQYDLSRSVITSACFIWS